MIEKVTELGVKKIIPIITKELIIKVLMKKAWLHIKGACEVQKVTIPTIEK